MCLLCLVCCMRHKEEITKNAFILFSLTTIILISILSNHGGMNLCFYCSISHDVVVLFSRGIYICSEGAGNCALLLCGKRSFSRYGHLFAVRSVCLLLVGRCLLS